MIHHRPGADARAAIRPRERRIRPWMEVSLGQAHRPLLGAIWDQTVYGVPGPAAIELAWGSEGHDPVWSVGVEVVLPAWVAHPLTWAHAWCVEWVCPTAQRGPTDGESPRCIP